MRVWLRSIYLYERAFIIFFLRKIPRLVYHANLKIIWKVSKGFACVIHAYSNIDRAVLICRMQHQNNDRICVLYKHKRQNEIHENFVRMHKLKSKVFAREQPQLDGDFFVRFSFYFSFCIFEPSLNRDNAFHLTLRNCDRSVRFDSFGSLFLFAINRQFVVFVSFLIRSILRVRDLKTSCGNPFRLM